MASRLLITCTFVAFVLGDQDYTQYVNVFTGTTGGGNMFPGVVAEPFASVKLGPDCAQGTTDAYAGYIADSGAAITGFSMLHQSGIGGAPKYGVVAQMPVLGTVPNPLADLSLTRTRGDQGSVGYFNSELEGDITVELAATAHAGFYQYSFPLNQVSSIVVDVSHVLPSYRGLGWGQLYGGGSFSIASDGHYEGSGTYSKGWNLSPDWNIYFCGRFDQQSISAKTFSGQGTTISTYGEESSVSSDTDRLGGVFSFNTTQVTSRVGVSWISSAQACKNLDNEIPSGSKLSTLVNNSKAKWNQEVFDKVTSTDSDTTNLPLLYTSLYGMHLMPSNRTGDNPKWQSSEPYYDDIVTFWDLFRCTTPLLHILQPTAYEEFLRSIIDIWRHDGWLPDARSSNFNGRTQGGSNADNILADAYVKGVRGDIDWDDGYAAMQTDAEKVPPNNNDSSAPDSSTAQGRGALPDWLQHGFITPKYTRAVTRAVEYSVNDFGLYQVASGLGKSQDAEKYLARSKQWRNHWNPAATSLGSTGFLVPREANGSFVDQDPLDCGSCYWDAPYYEGKPWEYTMNAHHDIASLIDMNGGDDAFVQRLNTMMDPANDIFDPGNEPSFTTPYLYNFVGRQDLSVQQTRQIAKKYYNAGSGGIPGNSDSGAMQSWILWNMIGLYPMTGQTTFLIGSPWFSNLTIATPSGKDLVITSTGGDGNATYYVQSLKVNGKTWTKNWVTWDDVFANGGSLDFVLGANASTWDTGDLPPSPATNLQNGAAMQQTSGSLGGPVCATPKHRSSGVLAAIIVAPILGVLVMVAAAVFFAWFKAIGPFKNRKTKSSTIETGEMAANLGLQQSTKAPLSGLMSWFKRREVVQSEVSSRTQSVGDTNSSVKGSRRPSFEKT